MVRAVLLDLYDTLVCANWHYIVEDMIARLGIDEATLLAAFESTREGRGTGRYASVQGDLGAVMEALARPRDDALTGELAAELLRRHAAAMRVYEDVPRFLARLRARGTPSAIVSNCDNATRVVLDRVPLPLDVDAVVLSCEAGSMKPHPAIFEQALAALRARPEEALFIDDQVRYLDGARALGMQTRCIIRAEAYGGPSEPGSHARLRSLDELDLE